MLMQYDLFGQPPAPPRVAPVAAPPLPRPAPEKRAEKLNTGPIAPGTPVTIDGQTFPVQWSKPCTEGLSLSLRVEPGTWLQVRIRPEGAGWRSLHWPFGPVEIGHTEKSEKLTSEIEAATRERDAASERVALLAEIGDDFTSALTDLARGQRRLYDLRGGRA